MVAQGLYLAVTLLCLGSCTDATPDAYEALTVAAASGDIVSLNGRTVTVQGWLSDPCGGYSCAIFPAPVKPGQNWPDGPYLSIAAETLVEPALTRNQGRHVLLRGVLSSQCRSNGVRCLDRAPDITPISVGPVQPATKDN